jgi:hypothetical protein
MRLANAGASISSQDIQSTEPLDAPQAEVPELPRQGNRVTAFPEDDPGAARSSERTAVHGAGSGFGPLLGRIFEAIAVLLGAGATTTSPLSTFDSIRADGTRATREAPADEPPAEVEEEAPASDDPAPGDEGAGDLVGPASEDERFA